MNREQRIEAGLIRPACYHLKSWGIEGYWPSLRQLLIDRGHVIPKHKRKKE